MDRNTLPPFVQPRRDNAQMADMGGPGVTFQQWQEMPRPIREANRLPVSPLGGQMHFNRFSVGLGMADDYGKNPSRMHNNGFPVADVGFSTDPSQAFTTLPPADPKAKTLGERYEDLVAGPEGAAQLDAIRAKVAAANARAGAGAGSGSTIVPGGQKLPTFNVNNQSIDEIDAKYAMADRAKLFQNLGKLSLNQYSQMFGQRGDALAPPKTPNAKELGAMQYLDMVQQNYAAAVAEAEKSGDPDAMVAARSKFVIDLEKLMGGDPLESFIADRMAAAQNGG